MLPRSMPWPSFGIRATVASADKAARATLAKLSAEISSSVSVDAGAMTASVQVSGPGAMVFASLILSERPIIMAAARATFAKSTGSGAAAAGLCVLALDGAMDRSLLVSGGGTVWAKDCWVQVNSNSAKAVTFSGNSKLTSAKNCFVGGVDQGLALMTPQPEKSCTAMADPFANYTKPLVGNCDHNGFKVSGERQH